MNENRTKKDDRNALEPRYGRGCMIFLAITAPLLYHIFVKNQVGGTKNGKRRIP